MPGLGCYAADLRAEREGQQIGGCDDHAQGEMSRLIIIYWAKNSSFYHS